MKWKAYATAQELVELERLEMEKADATLYRRQIRQRCTKRMERDNDN